MRKNNQFKSGFTIVEVVVAMTVFSILILLVMQIFGAMQNVWATTSAKTKTYQNARIIMEMIAADMQSAFYNINADPANSWCYYQNKEVFDHDARLWFVTHRQKSVQAKNSSLVQTGYWFENVTKDGVDLKILKNAVISNVGDASDLYDYNTKEEPDSGLTGTIDSEVKNYATVLDDNVLSLKVKPYVKKKNSSGNYVLHELGSSQYPVTSNDFLPSYVGIELEMLDDEPGVREEYLNGDSEKKASLVRKFSRIIEIDRGQYYEETAGGGS